MATLIRKCKVIVWDEATMSNKLALEAVERTFLDIRANTMLFGGIAMVFSGDFRQTLPVVRGGTRANEVDACFKESQLWEHVDALCTYPQTCVFICMLIHRLELLRMSC